MNSCNTYYSLSTHLDALLWCLYVCSQARSFQWRKFRVALPKLLIVWKRFFFRAFRSIAKYRYKWYVTKSVYVAMTVFATSWKKKNKKSSVLVCRRGFLCVKLCTVGLHNAMVRICFETNFMKSCLRVTPQLQWKEVKWGHIYGRAC